MPKIQDIPWSDYRSRLPNTEEIVSQGRRQYMAGGYTEQSNPYTDNPRLHSLWLRGFKDEKARVEPLFKRWREQDRRDR